MSETVLITGANRGIGLGLARILVENGFNVVATCRNPGGATELSKILESANQSPAVALDVGNDESVNSLKQYLETNNIKVNHLINNAGVASKTHPVDDPDKIDREDMLNQFNINVAGVARVTEVSGVLRDDNNNGRVINISSRVGSVTMTQAQGSANPNMAMATSYRCSKAALNMLTACFAIQHPHVTFLMVHPGWVQTDMG